MKELSIEEKAKRYDEAVAMAKECITHIPDEAVNKYMLNMFPELKESEDEKVIRDIKVVLESSATKFFKEEGKMPIWYDRAIAWLEKQGNEKDIHLMELKAKAYDDAKKRMSRAYNQNRVHIGFIHEIFPNLNLYENQGEFKNIDSDDLATLEIWEDAIKENKEKWQLSDWFVEATSLLIQKVKRIENNESINIKDSRVMLNACINVLRTAGHSHLSNWLEKQGEKKTIWHNKNEEPFSILHQDEIRLWSIEEAKDGDVLVASDNSIFIFARVDGHACIHHIALASDGTLKINPRLISAWESVKGVKPATEEQRDKLKKAMLKAGYKWNADKKELIRINV